MKIKVRQTDDFEKKSKKSEEEKENDKLKYFIIHFINNVDKQQTVSTQELSRIYYFSYFKRRPTESERQITDNMSKRIGQMISKLALIYPNIIKLKRGKYIIKPSSKKIKLIDANYYINKTTKKSIQR